MWLQFVKSNGHEHFHWGVCFDMSTYRYQFLLGRPCSSLTVANSNTENQTGVYETVHTISCNYGYVTPEMNGTFKAECQHNGIWNLTTCNSE